MHGVPHLGIVVGASLIAVTGYLGFSIYVFTYTHDAALQGDIIGTWKSFAVLAMGFWLGSSSGGKAKDVSPVETKIVNPPNEPVPVDAEPMPRPQFGKE